MKPYIGKEVPIIPEGLSHKIAFMPYYGENIEIVQHEASEFVIDIKSGLLELRISYRVKIIKGINISAGQSIKIEEYKNFLVVAMVHITELTVLRAIKLEDLQVNAPELIIDKNANIFQLFPGGQEISMNKVDADKVYSWLYSWKKAFYNKQFIIEE